MRYRFIGLCIIFGSVLLNTVILHSDTVTVDTPPKNHRLYGRFQNTPLATPCNESTWNSVKGDPNATYINSSSDFYSASAGKCIDLSGSNGGIDAYQYLIERKIFQLPTVNLPKNATNINLSYVGGIASYGASGRFVRMLNGVSQETLNSSDNYSKFSTEGLSADFGPGSATPISINPSYLITWADSFIGLRLSSELDNTLGFGVRNQAIILLNPMFRFSYTFTPTSIPNPPVGFSGAPQINSIYWSWTDQSDNEASFEFSDENSSIIATFNAQITEGGNGHNQSGLQPNTRYTRNIAAVNSLGKGIAQSSCVTLVQQPTNINITSIGSSSITLTVADNITNLNLGESGLFFRLLDQQQASGWIKNQSYTFSNLSPDTPYEFQVNARNQDGVQTQYMQINGRTLAGPISNLAITDLAPFSFNISWDINSNPPGTQFRLLISTSSDMSNYNVLSVAGTSVSVSGLYSHTEYFLLVQAINSQGNISDASSIYKTKTLFIDLSPPVGTVKVNGGSNITSNTNIMIDLNAFHKIDPVTLSTTGIFIALSTDGIIFESTQTFQQQIVYAVPDGNGLKRVYVKFIDTLGNQSIASDSIMLAAFKEPAAQIKIFSFSGLMASSSPVVMEPGTLINIELVTSKEVSGSPALKLLLPDGSTVPISLARHITAPLTWIGSVSISTFMESGIAQMSYYATDISGSTSTDILSAKSFMIGKYPQFVAPGSHDIYLALSKELANAPSVYIALPGSTTSQVAVSSLSTNILAWRSNNAVSIGNVSGAGSTSFAGRDLSNIPANQLVLGGNFTVDATSPTISFIGALSGRQFMSRSGSTETIPIQYLVADNYDPAPSSSALLISGSSSVQVSNNQNVLVTSLATGTWRLAVNAVDFVNNSTSVLSGTFDVILDSTPPSTPTGLVAVAISSRQINLTWSASADNIGIAGYDVFRNEVRLTSTSNLNYSDINLTPATTYSYAISAFDDDGNNSGLSLAVTTRTLGGTGGGATNVVLIGPGDSWKYFKGTAAPAAGWNTISFNDASWLSGPTGIGYGDGDDATVLADMQNNYVSVYCRRTFNITDPSQVSSMTLTVDYDDGYVAYLNGQEVSRKFMAAGTPSNTTLANDFHEAGVPEAVDISSYLNLLATGTNVLAIQVHNQELASSDLSLIPKLDIGFSSGGVPPPIEDTQPPSTPVGLAAISVSSCQAMLTWTPSSDNVAVAGYKLYRNGGSAISISGSLYIDSGLAGGTFYTYQISAYDAAGNESAQSNAVSTTTLTGPKVSTSAAGPFIFTAAGDYHSDPNTSATLDAMVRSSAAFNLALGDFSYDTISPESAWADYVKSHIGLNFPFQLISGNHEEDTGGDGFIGNFAVGLPDHMRSNGSYGERYYFDYAGLARFILVAPNLTINGHYYNFSSGTPDYNWLSTTIDSARTASIPWVIVGMHEVCMTMGEKSCEIGPDIINLLVNKKVDLVLQAHDHNYQRSKQLALNPAGGCSAISPNSYNSNCVTDASTSTYQKGKGPIIIISGASAGEGREYPINTGDSEAGYFAAWMGSNFSGVPGFAKFEVYPSSITGSFVTSAGTTTYTDRFTISTPTVAIDTITPAVPTGLVATAISTTQIRLNWTASSDNVGVTGYNIYKDGSQIAASSMTVYFSTGLAPFTTYSYMVSAFDAAGNTSSTSTVVTTRTFNVPDLAPPSVPTGLVATAISTTQISLSWVASADNVGVAGYNIYKDESIVATSSVTLYISTGLAPFTTYSFKLSAFDAAGNTSSTSTVVTTRTLGVPDLSSPSIPSGFTLVSLSSTQASFSWNASTDNVAVLGYKFFRDGVQVATAVSTSYTALSLSPSTTYSFNIAAFDAALNVSSFSTTITTRTLNPSVTTDTIAPSTPTGLVATAVSTAQINLSWSASTDNVSVVGYRLYRNGAQVSTPTGTSYSDLNLAPATTYSYFLTAFDAVDNRSSSSTVVSTRTFSLPDTSSPSTPTGLLAIAVSSTQINLTWNASTDNVNVTGYKLYRDSIQIATPVATSFSNISLTPSTTYSYYVRAFDAAGNVSTQSVTASTRTLTAPTPPPAGNEEVALIRQDCTGFTKCYTSLSAWEAAYGGITFTTCAAGNLVCQGKSAVAQIEGTWNNADATAVIIDGWTTGATNYIRIYTTPDARHAGKWTTNAYRIQSTDNPIEIIENHVRIDGLQLYMADTTQAQWRRGIYVGDISGTADIRIANSIIRSNGNIGSNGTGIAFEATGSNSKFYIINTAIYGFKADYIGGIRTYNANWTGYVYNCTINNNDYGIRNSGGNIIAKNTYAGGNTHAAYDGTITKAKAASSDGTGSTGLTNIAYSTLTGAAFNNIALGSEDFHLKDVSALKDVGVNTSTEAAPLNFMTDMEGQARSNPWDIGSDEAGTVEQDTTAPTIPLGLFVVSVSSSQVNLSWNASSDTVGVTGYYVYRNSGQIGSTAVTSFSDTNRTALTTYTYTVAAYDAASNVSAQSTSVTTRTLAAPDTTPPSTPTGLVATAVSTSQINLSWTASTDNVGVTGYWLFKNGSQISTVTATSYSDLNLSPATTYSYYLKAIDAAGNISSTSTVASTRTFSVPDVSSPSTPSGFTLVSLSSIQASFSWNASTDNVAVSGYKFFRDGVQVATAASTSYTDLPLSPSTTYSFRIAAFDAALNVSSFSATITTRTLNPSISPDTIAPSTPTGLAATAISTSQINLSWSASTDNVGVTGYKLFRNGAQISTPTATSYSDLNLSPATTYSYFVRAFDLAGNISSSSTVVSTRTLSVPDTSSPSVPSGLAILSVSSTQVSFAWNASTDNVSVAGYKFYRDGVQVSTPISTSYTDIQLTPSTTYSFYVAAFDAALNVSTYSASVSTRTLNPSVPPDTIAPSTPTNLAATAISTSQINLGWNASTDNVGVTGYKLFRNGAQISTPTGTAYSDLNLAPSTTYSYYVKAFDAAGNVSSTSTIVSTRTFGVPDLSSPSVPAGLVAAAISTSQINLSWSASTDNVTVAGYAVYRSSVQIASTTLTNYSDLGLAAFTTYSYQVAAYDTAGNISNKSLSASTRTLATVDTSSPSIPTGLAIVSVSSSQASFTWSASTDNVAVTGYRFYRNGSQVGVSTITSYTDTNLTPSTTYGFSVAAVDAAMNVSSQSVMVATRTLTAVDTTSPTVATGLAAVALSSHQIFLSWTASSDDVAVAGYKIFRSTNQIATSTMTSYLDSGLAPLTTYNYRVSAYDAAGNNSGLSSTATAVTQSSPSATNEDVALIRQNCSGYSKCYTSLAAWEAAFGGVSFGTSCASGNLVCAKKSAAAQIDGSWVSADTTPVIIDGWTTGASYYIRIYTTPAARHQGKWSTSTYRIQSNENPIEIVEEFVTLDGLQLYMADTTESQWRRGVYVGEINGAADIRIMNSLIRANGSIGSNGTGIAFESTGANSRFYVTNTAIYGFKSDYVAGIRTYNGNWTGYIYNCTLNNNDYGIRNSGGSIIAKNTYAGGNTHAGYNGTISLTKCASSDGTGSSGLQNIAYSAGSGAAFNGITLGSEDFHIKSTSLLKDVGINTSTETAPLNYAQDYDGETRSGTWDIGADEYGSAAMGAPSFGLRNQGLEEEQASTTGLDPTFKLGEVYSYPNPAAGGRNPTIHVECGIADFVEVRFYDLDGTLLHEGRIDQPLIIDNKYAYEYTWNSSGIASGVYVYIVAGKKSGERDLRITKKLAILK